MSEGEEFLTIFIGHTTLHGIVKRVISYDEYHIRYVPISSDYLGLRAFSASAKVNETPPKNSGKTDIRPVP